MGSLAILQSLRESIQGQATVKTVYGEPIENSTARGKGGGVGGAARAIPVRVVEVSPQNTRFVPITDRKKLAGAVALGVGLGMWLGWRRR